MKLSSVQIEQALDQFEADVVPENNPVIPQLTRLFGDHTYFLDQTGLNIVEPAGHEQQNGRDGPMGVVVNIANWTGEGSMSLVPHEPETTSVCRFKPALELENPIGAFAPSHEREPVAPQPVKGT